MRLKTTFLVLFLTFTCAKGQSGDDLLYGPGNDNWCSRPGECCTGRAQSPINLPSLNRYQVNSNRIADLLLSNHDEKLDWVVDNNGKTMRFMLQSTQSNRLPTIRGGSLRGIYTLGLIGFSWGSDNSRGSEHTINGASWPFEAFIVYYSSSYRNVGDALASPTPDDAVAFLSILFPLSQSRTSYWNRVVQFTPRIRYNGMNTTAYGLSANDIATTYGILKDGDNPPAYNYYGSLIIPPCYQNAVWFVQKSSRYPISTQELNSLRTLYFTSRGSPNPQRMQNNDRPIQPLNGRRISYSFVTSDQVWN